MKTHHEQYAQHHELLSKHWDVQHKIACEKVKAGVNQLEKSCQEAWADCCASIRDEHKSMADYHKSAIDTGGRSDEIDMGTTLGPKTILTGNDREAAFVKDTRVRWGGVSGINLDPAQGLRAVPRAGAPSLESELDGDTEAIDQLARRHA